MSHTKTSSDTSSKSSSSSTFQPSQSTVLGRFYALFGFKRRWIFLLLIVLRLLNASLITSYIDPDEHWQSFEPAYALVSSNPSFLTWEWTQMHKIRSWIPIIPYALSIKILNTPLLAQAFLAASLDYYTMMLALVLFGGTVARWTLVLSLSSWFNSVYMCKGYAGNVIESICFMAWLCYWKMDKWSKGAIFAALGFMSRPTIAMNMLLPGLLILKSSSGYERIKIVKDSFLIGISIVGLAWSIDRFNYQRLGLLSDSKSLLSSAISCLTPWTFFKVNFLDKKSSLYGTSPWFYYLPCVMAIGGPIYWGIIFIDLFKRLVNFFKNFFSQFSTNKRGSRLRAQVDLLRSHIFVLLNSQHLFLWASIGWIVIWHSFLLAHKELRFISPINPLLVILTARALYFSNSTRRGNGQSTLLQKLKKHSSLLALLVFVHGMLFLLLGRWFQQGSIKSIQWLRQNIPRYEQPIYDLTSDARMQQSSVLFLMPCHSTPMQSILQKPEVRLRYLTCIGRHQGLSDEDTMMLNDKQRLKQVINESIKKATGHQLFLVAYDNRGLASRVLLTNKDQFELLVRIWNGGPLMCWAGPERCGDILIFRHVSRKNKPEGG